MSNDDLMTFGLNQIKQILQVNMEHSHDKDFFHSEGPVLKYSLDYKHTEHLCPIVISFLQKDLPQKM